MGDMQWTGAPTSRSIEIPTGARSLTVNVWREEHGWYMSCPQLNQHVRPLDVENVEEAQREALDQVRHVADEYARGLRMLIEPHAPSEYVLAYAAGTADALESLARVLNPDAAKVLRTNATKIREMAVAPLIPPARELDDPAEYVLWQSEMAERSPHLRVTWTEWKGGMRQPRVTTPPPTLHTQKCCPRDNDGDGNCPVHARPGVRRGEIFEALDPPEPCRACRYGEAPHTCVDKIITKKET